ncbi:MAG: hypothetical protein JO057_02850 [Chloroflexi bacterium]|nr:hypothetical protein [Chloroflexota bacterium]
MRISSTLLGPQVRSVAAVRESPWFNVRAAAPRVLAVVVYGVAMAYVESAAVLYLRTIYGGVDPVGPRHSLFQPLPDFVGIEVGREAATMLMLGSVGYLAASTAAGRIGAFAVAMGIWDIFYYVFLWLFAGWPESPLAPDVLFLIPLPWWGPVAAPVLLALVIVVAGSAAMARELGDGLPRLRRAELLTILGGAGLCLAAFMANALVQLPDGLAAAFNVRGGPFAWPIYLLGVAVGSLGLFRSLRIV